MRAGVLARAGAYMRTLARVLVVMSTPKQTSCQASKGKPSKTRWLR